MKTAILIIAIVFILSNISSEVKAQNSGSSSVSGVEGKMCKIKISEKIRVSHI